MTRMFYLLLLLAAIFGFYVAFTVAAQEPNTVNPELEESKVDESMARYLNEFEQNLKIV